MDLNIRNIDPKLLKTLKSKAALNEQSLKDFCITLLSAIYQPDFDTFDETIKRANVPFSDSLAAIPEPKRTQLLLGSWDTQHDSKTCRIYKCGMCAGGK